MLSVPLYVEGLRTRPALVFALATLAQTALWVLVPMVFYAAPPGDLPQVLAIGRQLPLRGDFGPPLAYWLAEAAFRVGGLFAVYLLAQICVATTYACVFLLGSAIVGATYAAMAVLMMTGISVFTVPTPDFGPPLLTAALWALLLLHYWRAVMQKQRASWFVLGAAAALLLATSAVAVILIGLVIVFTAATARGRASLRTNEPIMVGIALVCFLFLHVFWLGAPGDRLLSALDRLRDAQTAGGNTAAWLRLVAGLVGAHAGLVILVVLASGWPRTFSPAPVFAPADRAFRPDLCDDVRLRPGARGDDRGRAVRRAAADRRLRAALGLVRPRRDRRGRRAHHAPSPAHRRLRLGRFADRAGDFRSDRHRGVAVGDRDRSESGAAGERHGPFLRPKLRAADRAPARDRQRRRDPRGAGRGRRAEPAERLPRRGSGAFALDHRAGRRDAGRRRGLARYGNSADPPPAIKARFPDLVAEVPKTFDRRCAAGCRRCGSAGA